MSASKHTLAMQIFWSNFRHFKPNQSCYATDDPLYKTHLNGDASKRQQPIEGNEHNSKQNTAYIFIKQIQVSQGLGNLGTAV